MKHCPECNVEYQEIAVRCSDCDAVLLPGSPEEESHAGVTLELVYATGKPALIALIKSLLDDAGIRYLAKGDDVQDLFGWGRFGTPVASVVGPVEFFVASEEAVQAREILAHLEGPILEAPTKMICASCDREIPDNRVICPACNPPDTFPSEGSVLVRHRELTLEWTQCTSLRCEYELRTGNDVVARLHRDESTLAESPDGSWTFNRSGRKVTVCIAGSESEVAVFTPNWMMDEGTLEYTNRCRYWLKPSFWRSEWAFANEAREPLVHFKPKFTLLRVGAKVKVEPIAASIPDLSLLTLLGWYLMLLMWEATEGADGY